MKSQFEPADYEHLLITRKRSSSVIFRDVLLTLLCWSIVCLMLTDVWLIAFDYLKDPIFSFLPQEAPDWDLVWGRLRIFVYFSTLLIFYISISALVRYKKLRREVREDTESEEHIAERIAQAALNHGSMAHHKWHELSDAHVYFDEKGDVIRVTNRV